MCRSTGRRREGGRCHTFIRRVCGERGGCKLLFYTTIMLTIDYWLLTISIWCLASFWLYTYREQLLYEIIIIDVITLTLPSSSFSSIFTINHIIRYLLKYWSNCKDLTIFWKLSSRRMHLHYLYHFFTNRLNFVRSKSLSEPAAIFFVASHFSHYN